MNNELIKKMQAVKGAATDRSNVRAQAASGQGLLMAPQQSPITAALNKRIDKMRGKLAAEQEVLTA